MTPNAPLESRIRSMIFELTTIPTTEIGLDDDLFLDLGMDSVAALELVGMMDEAFDLDVEIEEALQARTVRQVLELAAAHLTPRE